MAAKENLAYDFSLFESREERRQEAEVKKSADTELRVVKKARAAARVSVGTVIRVVMVSTIIVASLCCIMLNNVKLTELNDKISRAQTQLSNARSENVALNMQLESRMSFQNIEDEAVNRLGLQKVQNYQITYISMNSGDKVEIDGSGSNTFFNNAANFLHGIVEYFK